MNNFDIRLHTINRIILSVFNKRTFCVNGSWLRLLMVAMLLPQIVFAQLPVDPVVVHGNASIDVTGNHMSITNNPGTVINWQDFSIGDGSGVYFQQQDASSQILNRITGNNASEIFGNLSSNGGVWLINPHGVFIGENARIDVGSLVTSTLNISDFDFLANNYQFDALESGSGNVANHGEIRTSLGGHVWLLGGQVHHDGLIQSSNGQIILAAGQHIEMIDSGAPNMVVRIEAPENDVVNLGHLVSTNGQIDVLGSIVNLEGVERAQSVSNDESGNIVLQSAETLMLSENSVMQAGTGAIDLAADDILHEGHIMAHAGEVSLKAADLTYLDGQIDVSDQNGTGGKILLETGKLEGMANGALIADGQQGGQIRVIGENSVAFSSTLQAMGNDQGGKIEVSGDSVILLNAEVDASVNSGQGGTVHLGGGWQGEGDLPHAREVIVGVGSEVRANGSEKGGEIVVSSEQTSEHHGLLQAKQGGSVEFSSNGEIQQAGIIQTGLNGTLLSDSANTVINDAPLVAHR